MFVECFRNLETFCQFVTKRGSVLGEIILFSKLPKREFVSFKDWLIFVSKIERKEPNYYERPDGHMDRSYVMQLRTPVLKPKSSVRCPFAACPDAFERAAPKD
jgi:hypothetical protein